MTISVHGADHFGATTSVHIGVQLLYTERTLYVPFQYIHFGTFSNTGVNNDLHRRYIFKLYNTTVYCALSPYHTCTMHQIIVVVVGTTNIR